jgi:hypothetical protein
MSVHCHRPSPTTALHHLSASPTCKRARGTCVRAHGTCVRIRMRAPPAGRPCRPEQTPLRGWCVCREMRGAAPPLRPAGRRAAMGCAAARAPAPGWSRPAQRGLASLSGAVGGRGAGGGRQRRGQRRTNLDELGRLCRRARLDLLHPDLHGGGRPEQRPASAALLGQRRGAGCLGQAARGRTLPLPGSGEMLMPTGLSSTTVYSARLKRNSPGYVNGVS